MPLKPGKLPIDLMKKLLNYFKPTEKNSRIIIGPHIGQNFAAIDMGDKFLISKTNPITFATDEIGYFVVTINANDVALSGAIPKWFSSTIFLPEKSTEIELCENIFNEIATECKKISVSVIGGHTEVTIGLTRPIIAGNMLGEVKKEKFISTMGARPGDSIILTKGIAIEGTTIIAREMEQDLLKKGIDQSIINKCKEYLHTPGISILKEAQLITNNFEVHAMHGPTEGGFSMGIVELLSNSKCGIKIDYNHLIFHLGTKELCQIYDINPLNLISSGTLLVSVNPKDVKSIIELLHKNGIDAQNIGTVIADEGSYLINMGDAKYIPLNFSPIDEITKIFE